MTQPAAPVGPGVTLANWRTAEFLRWSFQHSRQVVPTARVSRGNGPVAALPEQTRSVTDLPVSTVAGILVDQGVLDPEALLTAYVPELAASGYAGATVRHVLDMRSGVTFSEDYRDPDAEIRRLEQCIGWTQSVGVHAPASLYDFLVTLQQGSPHGGPFSYRSCET